jgi:hypothetical protein
MTQRNPLCDLLQEYPRNPLCKKVRDHQSKLAVSCYGAITRQGSLISSTGSTRISGFVTSKLATRTSTGGMGPTKNVRSNCEYSRRGGSESGNSHRDLRPARHIGGRRPGIRTVGRVSEFSSANMQATHASVH